MSPEPSVWRRTGRRQKRSWKHPCRCACLREVGAEGEGDALETIFGKLMGAATKAGEDPTKALDNLPASVREALAVASPEELKMLAAMSEDQTQSTPKPQT